MISRGVWNFFSRRGRGKVPGRAPPCETRGAMPPPDPATRPATPVHGSDGADGPAVRGLLKERAYAEIKQRILSGAFAPGTFLSERQLALQLQMSKTPIRAATERLEQEGFLTISPQQGIVVHDLS